MIEVKRDQITHQCASVTEPLTSGETRNISCAQGAIGNIVRIRMTNSTPQILSLCEVEVFGINGKGKRRHLCLKKRGPVV